MPELDFKITDVDASVASMTPMLRFKLLITNSAARETIQTLLLNTQIQFQPAQRSYNQREQAKLVELFGAPESWGQTLRNRFWTQTTTMVGPFNSITETSLQLPCTYDLNVAATKYILALDGGEVSLLFLFSGSVFYLTPDQRLQVAPISWNKEAVFRMPVQAWNELMERHYPNSAWLMLQRRVFDQLCAFKRNRALPSWDSVMEQLLQKSELTHEPAAEPAAVQTEKAEVVA